MREDNQIVRKLKIFGKDVQVWESSAEITVCGQNISWELAAELPKDFGKDFGEECGAEDEVCTQAQDM